LHSAGPPYPLCLGQDLPQKNGPGVSNEPEEHQQAYQDMEQEQAQVPQPPAANKNTVRRGELMYKRYKKLVLLIGKM